MRRDDGTPSSPAKREEGAIETDVPARLDRLPWSRFHVLIVAALGITWILDGIEVTIVGSIGPVLQNRGTLALSAAEIGDVASCYIVGAVVGSVLFGWLTDRFGRRFVFYATLILYLLGVFTSACAWSFWSFAAFRALTGFGIGGEYAAINSAIDELIPARLRGRVDLIVNGSFWLGAAAGAGASLLLLDPRLLPIDFGWRLGFGIGGVLGLAILVLRRWVPESPRWLVTHGRLEGAEQTLDGIERDIVDQSGERLETPAETITVHPRKSFGFLPVLREMVGRQRQRSLLALTLMVAQAFLFNSVFFTYALVLERFYKVPEDGAGLYLVPLALGNFLGPVLLGPLFDTIGRRRMIAGTFALSGVLLTATAFAFASGVFSAWTQTAAWIVIFFFASAASSSAYLTASEIFPLETRALAIALFYALGTVIGGTTGPWLFGRLIDANSQPALAWGYGLAAALLLAAAAMEAWAGVDAEGKSLESIAEPMSATR